MAAVGSTFFGNMSKVKLQFVEKMLTFTALDIANDLQCLIHSFKCNSSTSMSITIQIFHLKKGGIGMKRGNAEVLRQVWGRK